MVSNRALQTTPIHETYVLVSFKICVTPLLSDG